MPRETARAGVSAKSARNSGSPTASVVAGEVHLYVMVGIPGCGKTTIARQRFPHALRISLDDLRLMFTGRTFDIRVESAVAIAAESLKESLAAFAASKRVDLLHDATNVSRTRRAALIETARRHGISPVAVYLPVPIDVALSRNQQRPFPVPNDVIVRFLKNLEPPSIDEGFDGVIVVEPDASWPTQAATAPR